MIEPFHHNDFQYYFGVSVYSINSSPGRCFWRNFNVDESNTKTIAYFRGEIKTRAKTLKHIVSHRSTKGKSSQKLWT